MKYIVSGFLFVLIVSISPCMAVINQLSNTTSESSSERSTQMHEVLSGGYHQFLDDMFDSIEPKQYQFSREAFLASIGYPIECQNKLTDSVIKSDLVHEDNSAIYFDIEISIVCKEGVSVPVTGVVALPKDKDPKGLVVAIHGTAATPQKIFGLEESDNFSHAGYHHKFGRDLVNDQFAVFAPAILTQKKLINKSYNTSRNQVDRRAAGIGLRLQGIEVWSISTSIGIIKEFFNLNNTQTGVYGISLGGGVAFYIAAVNKEISATVISNWSEERVSKIFSGEHATANWRYEDNDYVIFQNGVFYTRDQDIIKNLIHPRPIFFEVGANDDRSVGVLPLVDNLLELPGYMGNNSQRLCLHIGSGGHEIFYDKAESFLSRWLSDSDTGKQIESLCPPGLD